MVVFAVAVLVTQLGMDGDTRIHVIGFMGAALNIVMYASPLSSMVRINSILILRKLKMYCIIGETVIGPVF